MNIKLIAIASAFTCATAVTAGTYNNYSDSEDYAVVVQVDSIYNNQTIHTPYRDCYTKQVHQRTSGDGTYTNEILGGLLGGVIGNQFGKGTGRDVMTGAGAILGASIANDGERSGYQTVNKEVCETRYRESMDRQFDHYLVRYDYKGRIYTAKSNRRLKEGDDIKVRINVTPIF